MNDEQRWRCQARVYRAGAKAQRVYGYNIERQQQAESLEAMAKECDRIADEIAAGDWAGL